MGNLLQSSATSSSGSGRQQRQLRTLDSTEFDTTWVDFQEKRWSPYSPEMNHEDGINGFALNGFSLPDTVIERILSWVNPEDILNLNLVCRNWKDIIQRKSYWKIWFDRKGWDWNMIPEHVKQKPHSWIVFHAQVKYHVFTKNYVKNHSGVGDQPHTYRHWTIYRNGGDGWTLEQPPTGTTELPRDDFFGNNNCTWASSFVGCSKWTSAEFWDQGLSRAVLMTILPFNIVCSQMYATRFDCGGRCTWILRVMDCREDLIEEFSNKYDVPAMTHWQTMTHKFHYGENLVDQIGELRSVAFCHEGCDSRFWKGHYGIKLCRCCVRIELLDPKSDMSPYHNKSRQCRFHGYVNGGSRWGSPNHQTMDLENRRLLYRRPRN